jgi:SAM-dependent methyltransferase
VLELGCGLGRFTRLLAESGLKVTAVDLAPSLVETLAAELPRESGVELVCCPAEMVCERVSGKFRAVVGFFFLHHQRRLEPVCRAARSMLEPGGRVAFCEPNALNPMYYLQVTLTPGMSWRGEAGLPLMRVGRVFPAMTAAGLEDCRHHLYGVLPPFVANTRAGTLLDRMLEAVLPQRVTAAYGVFAAERRQ